MCTLIRLNPPCRRFGLCQYSQRVCGSPLVGSSSSQATFSLSGLQTEPGPRESCLDKVVGIFHDLAKALGGTRSNRSFPGIQP